MTYNIIIIITIIITIIIMYYSVYKVDYRGAAAPKVFRVFRDRDVKDRVRFVVRFDPRLPDLNNISKQSWSVMFKDPAMSKVFPSPPIWCVTRGYRALGRCW